MTNVNHSLSNLVVGYYNNNKVGVIWKRMLHGQETFRRFSLLIHSFSDSNHSRKQCCQTEF